MQQRDVFMHYWADDAPSRPGHILTKQEWERCLFFRLEIHAVLVVHMGGESWEEMKAKVLGRDLEDAMEEAAAQLDSLGDNYGPV